MNKQPYTCTNGLLYPPSYKSSVFFAFSILGLLSFPSQGADQPPLTKQGGPQSPVSIEMHKVEIPEIGGSVNVPSSWSIVTFFEAKQSVEKTQYINQEAKELALASAQSIGAQSFKVAKYVEPYFGLNYSLSIAWSPISNLSEFNNIPLEARSGIAAKVLDSQILPKIKSLSRDFQVVEAPTPIDATGSGAWVTYKEKVTKESQDASLDATLTTRLYLLPKQNYFVLVTLSFPETDEQTTSKISKDILGEMLRSFQIEGD